MREALFSQWDARMQIGAKNTDEAVQLYNFVTEIENLDKAHKRAKRELRKQQKAIIVRNNAIDFYRWAWQRADATNMRLMQENRQLKLEQSEQSNMNEKLWKYEHMVKACGEYFEENQELKEENQELFEESRELTVKNQELKEENERLKKELEYQELHNSKLAYANVKQVETIGRRNAEVEALKQMINNCGSKYGIWRMSKSLFWGVE